MGSVAEMEGTQGWWKASWRVLLVTVALIPIVLPPAVIILMALGLFLATSVFTMLESCSGNQSSSSKQPLGKEVNVPTFEWKIS